MEVGRVPGVAAPGHDDRELRQARLELAQDRRGDAARRGGVLRRSHHHELALGAPAGVVVRPVAVAGPAGFGERGQRGPLHRPRPALGDREHAGAPVALLGLMGSRPDDEHGGAARQVAAQLARPGDDVLPIGDPARQQVLEEVPHRRLRGPGGRLRPVDLEGDQVRHEPLEGGRRRCAAGPEPELAHRKLGHAKVDPLGAAFAGHDGALVLARLARHGQHAARRVEHDHARVERPACRPGDRRQPRAGLDRLRDLVERLEEGGGVGGRPSGAAVVASRLAHQA